MDKIIQFFISNYSCTISMLMTLREYKLENISKKENEKVKYFKVESSGTGKSFDTRNQ